MKPVLFCVLSAHVAAQGRDQFLSRTSPGLAFEVPEPAKYNLKWGKLKGSFRATMTGEFNDNINLSEHGKVSDFYLGPLVGVGLFYPISHRNILSMDLGVGYRWYVENSNLSTVHITPDTHVDYRFWLKDVQVNVHDDFRVQIDPTSRPELSGGVFNYRRFINNAGIDFGGQPWESWSWTAGYNHTLDRTLNNEFKSLDRNAHTFNGGLYHVWSPRWTTGIYGAYTINDYVLRIQNNNTGWSIGPTVVWKPTEFLVFDGSVMHTRYDYSTTGSIADISDFQGVTFQAGARHTINSRMHHALRLRRSLELGLASNFTDAYALQYELNARVTGAVSLTGTFVYQHFSVSGTGGEDGDQMIFQLGSYFKLSPRCTLGLSYVLGLKNSALADRDYTQNRVTVELTRRF